MLLGDCKEITEQFIKLDLLLDFIDLFLEKYIFLTEISKK